MTSPAAGTISRERDHPTRDDGHEGNARRPSIPRRRRRRLLIASIVVAFVALTTPWLATRPSTMRLVAEWVLRQRFEGEVEIGSIVHLGRGLFRLRDIHLRAPGWQGEAGDAVSISVLDLTIDPSRLWHGQVSVEAIDIESALVRIAERASSPGSFNLQGLVRRDRGEGMATLPRLTVGSLAVETGSVDADGRWTLSGSTVLRGQLEPRTATPPRRDPALQPIAPSVTGDSHWIVFDLREESPDGLALQGRFDPTTLEHELRMGAMELTPRLRALCPITVRSVWDLMEPSGRIEGVVAQWTRGSEPFAEASIAGARITMPIEVEGQWVRLRGGRVEPTSGRPRLHVQQGRLRLAGDSFHLDRLRGDLIGTDTDTPLVGVPFTLQFRAPKLSRMVDGAGEGWVADALKTAPFELEFQLLDFTIASEDPEREDVVELPLAVADVLEGLRLRRWTISSVLDMRRGDPTVDATGRVIAGAVTWSGRAVVSNATMAYERFAYTLLDTEAFLTFDQDRVVVSNLRGRGVAGGLVTVSGEVTRPGPGAGYALRIVGRDIPLDDELIAALPPDAARTVRFLIDEPAWKRLDEAGVAPSAARLEAWRHERATLGAGATDPIRTQSQPQIEASTRSLHERRIAALDRRIQLGSWSPGGTVDIDFTANRAVGEKKMIIAGRVDLAGVVGVCRAFPYPFRVSTGSIELAPGEVSLLDGLTIETLGGGAGRIEGRIGLPSDGSGRKVEPALRIVVADDEINPTLFAAIPSRAATAAGQVVTEPGRASGAGADDAEPTLAIASFGDDDDEDPAQWLRDAGLEGHLDAHASIGSEPDPVSGHQPRITWSVVASLSDGLASPALAIERLLQRGADDRDQQVSGRERDRVPGGESVAVESGEAVSRLEGVPTATELQARIDIDPHRVIVSDLRGRFGGAPMHASIEIDLAGSRETRVAVNCAGQSLERWMIGLAPINRRERLRTVWDRLQPSGTVDIDVAGTMSPAAATTLSLDMGINAIEVTVDERVVAIEGRSGSLRAGASGITFDDLLVALRCEGSDQGELMIKDAGREGGAETSGDRLALRWSNGSLESPLLAEALRQLGHRELVAEASRFDPRGRFDLDLETAYGDPPPLDALDLTLLPRDVVLQIGATPVAIRFDDGASISLHDERVTLEKFAGRFARGSFRLEGSAWLGDEAPHDPGGVGIAGHAGDDTRVPAGGMGGELLLDFVGEGLPPEVRAILPQGIVDTMDEIELQLEGRTAARGRLRLNADRPDVRDDSEGEPGDPSQERSAALLRREWVASFDGAVEVERASFHAGLDVSDLSGRVALRAQGGTMAPPIVEIEPVLDEVFANGRRLEDARGRIVVDRGAAEVRIQSLRARMEEGVLEARGVIGTDDGAPYLITIEGAGIPLGALAPLTAESARTTESGSAQGATSAQTMGRLTGRLHLDGARGSPTSRRGRGAVEIRDARMGSMPLTLGLLQLSQLMLPINDTLSRADAEFYVVGDTLTFERLDLTSDTLRLLGSGELDLPTMTLAARFSAGGPLPLVSDLVRSLSDQLYAIELKGPIMSPKAGLVPLPTLGTLLPRSPRPASVPPAGAADAPPPLVPRLDREHGR